MQLVAYRENGVKKAGWLREQGVVPIPDLWPNAPQEWRAMLAYLHQHKNDSVSVPQEKVYPDVSELVFDLPVAPESKILCIGLNYRDHAAEGKLAIPEFPVVFSRFYSSFVPHLEKLRLSPHSDKFDYEAELVIVIGAELREASREAALAGVYGYTVAMDGTMRDYQKRAVQWTLGKNFDASGSIGPWIVAAEDLPLQARDLHIQAKLNGELLQHGSTADMIFDVAILISTISQCMTLQPGDMILTGTPAGVGFARTPPVYLRAEDRLEVSVEGIGTLCNEVAE